MTIYQDIDISFSKHPSTGDILKLYDVSAAKYALKNLLLTSAGEKLSDPEFGIGIKEYQFELPSPILNLYIKKKILLDVSIYLPEIRIEECNVSTNPDSGELGIIIEFYVVGNPELQKYNLVLNRTR